MDGWGIVIFVAGLLFYYISKKQVFFMFVAGVGAGIFIGAIWAMVLVNRFLR